MEKAVKMQIRKDLNGRQQQDIIKLKGSLISNGYTQIIHIMDQDEEFHINSFETEDEKRNEVHDFIKTFVDKADLADAVFIK